MLSNAKSFRSAWPLVSVTFAMFAAFSLSVHGQSPQPASPLTGSVVDDWSHHRQVFSNPGTEQEAIDHGTYSRWWKIVNEPRYAMQQAKKSLGQKTLDESSVRRANPFAGGLRFGRPGPEPGRGFTGDPYRLHAPDDLNKDWNVPGLAAGQVQPNMYPAKFSFSTTTSSCASDYVVYPTGVAGSATKADIVAYNDLYVGAGGCQTTLPLLFWAYNTGGGTVTTSPVISNDATGSQVAYIQVTGTTASLVLLKWNANTTGRTVTGVLSASSPNVTISAGTFTAADVGAQITGTGIPAGDTIASVISGTTANLATAPAAHVSETLTIVAEALATPGAPPLAASAAAYRSCTAPCYFTVSLGANDTYSAPYYDYTDDAMYVGDDAGKLHKITGVFNGSAIAEAASWPVTLNANFPTTSPVYDTISGYVFAGNTGGVLYAVGTGNVGTTDHTIHGTSSALGAGIIDAPIVDSTSEKVYAFVGSTGAAHSLTTCSVPNTSATITCTSGTFTAADVGATINSTNTTLAADTITGFTSGTVATLSATNFSGTISGASITLLDTGSDAVYQFAATFTSGAGSQETLGTGGGDHFLYDGAFDNVYYSSASGTAGDLWVVGNTVGGGANFGANLYRVPISGTGTMGTPVAMISNITDNSTGHNGWPSPLTEFCNNGASACTSNGTITTGGTDHIYFSVDRVNATTGACTNAAGVGCLLGYSINTPTNTPTNVGGSVFTTIGTPGCWATSGIVIDNSVPAGTQVGASELYFMALNGNSAGGPTSGTATSGSCGTFSTANTPSFLQESQSAP